MGERDVDCGSRDEYGVMSVWMRYKERTDNNQSER